MNDRPTHPYQISILRQLTFKSKAKFSDLNKLDIPNDHFSFHLKSLMENGYIEKDTTGYNLTIKGKQISNLIDTDGYVYEKQAKLSVALHAIRYNKGQLEILAHQRLKHPFFGYWGSHSGKIRMGETPLECAEREFFEETGLTGNFKLKAIAQYINTHTNGTLLEDKYFFIYIIKDTQGTLKETIEEGRNKWVGEEEYRSFEHTFGSWDRIVEEINSKKLKFFENKKVLSEY